ncbi:MAG: serine/threonine protein kinase [Rhodanobacteraceae bacterium]|nr:serine/threonine protein kinase [Rhodanobacteraceae bacterium]
MPANSPLDLLEPGALLAGALFRSMVTRVGLQASLPIGTRVGPFRILAEIGAGGMGVVYRAERADGQYQQFVAIKCVTGGDSVDALAQFRRERQILAEMRHPHIARLLDGGQLDDCRLWFAMELIDGARIDAHVRASVPSVAARIGLLRQVIDAVACAHQRLLLHRDIKPANVLIDADGSAKLLDFGIAALAGDQAAARAYTPDWASPEQISGGEIGPASDQFQLGLLLDALLRSPAQPADRARWIEMPTGRAAELRAIVTRATAPDPQQRYGSVQELDADLGRWLAARPVSAVGQSLEYTLRCAVRRHPLIAVASVTTALTIVALVIGFSWRLAQERDLARAQAERATREAANAAAVAHFLQDDLLALADPNTSQDVQLTVQTLLERARGTVDQRLAGQPEIAAQIHATLARSLRGLGDFEAANAEFELAESKSAALAADSPWRLELDLWHGDLDLARSLPREAYARLQRVADAAAGSLGSDSQLALEAAVRAQAARFELGEQQPAIDALTALLPRLDKTLGVDAPLSIYALNRLAIMLNTVERSADSERVRSEHLLRAARAYGADHSATLTGRLNRAVLLRKLGRLDEALVEALAAEDGLRRVFGANSVAVLHAMNARSRILQDSKRFDEAIALQRQTLAGRIALLGEQHDDVAYSHVNLGGMLMQTGDLDGAIDHYESALKIRESLLGPEHVDVITNLTLLADTERMRGELGAAERYAELAVERGRRVLAGDRVELATALFRYAQVLAAREQTEAARTNASEALGIYALTYPDEHPRLLAVRQLMAGLPASETQ